MPVDDGHVFSEFMNGTNGGAQLNDLYTKTTHRVRQALFPEISIDDDFEELGNKNTSIVGSFAQPSQSLKNAILDLLSIRGGQVDIGTNTIPQLINNLNEDDPELVAKATHDVFLLSREDKFIAQLANNDALIGALVKVVSSTSDNNVKHDAVAGLSRISHQGSAACYRIFRTGGIPELIRMLSNPIIRILHYAVTTLHNLLIYTEMSKEEIINCGGLEALTPLLAKSDEKLQAMVTDSIYLLLLDQPQCKLLFLSLRGSQLLLNIMRTTNYLKLLYAVIRCIRSISICQQNKMALISLGALELLHSRFKETDNNKWRLTILTAMRNMSDSATNLDTLSPLVNELIKIVNDYQDEEIVSCACGILSNLTCNNILNKQTICLSNGIKVLGMALSRFINVEDITEPSLCALRHCTVRHPLAHQAQNDIVFAHQIILNLLATRRPPIVKAALGLLRNCVLIQKNLESIISKSLNGETSLSIAVEILETTGVELRVDFNGLIDGVSLIEMVEGAISALHQLAKEPSVAKYIYKRPGVMNVLVDLMSHEQIYQNDDELLMREIMGLIYQLTKSLEGAKTVMEFGFHRHIVSSLNSTHRSIAAYARIILRNIGAETNERQFSQTNGYIQKNNQTAHEVGWLNDGMELELYNELYNYPPSLVEMNRNDSAAGARTSTWFDTDL